MYKIAVFLALFASAYGGELPAAPAGVTYTFGGAAPAAVKTFAAAPAPVAYAQPAVYAQPAPAVVKTFHQPAFAYAAQPVVKAVAPAAVVKTVAPAEPFDPNPQYSYSYSVSDALSGDSKSASETRNGDVVKGQYSLVEPDGAIRTVTYTADPVNGFNAIVDRSAPTLAVKTVQPVVKAVAPAVVKAPVYAAQPAYYAQPAQAVYAQQPAYYAQPAQAVYAQQPAYYAQPAQAVYAQPAAAQVVKTYAQPAQAVVKTAGPAVVSTTFNAPYATYAY